MIKLKIILLIFILFSMTTSCFSQRSFPYLLERPDQVMVLPQILKEISGLAISSDGNYLFAIQDELGTIFQLEKTSGKILQSIPFGKSGDYEGIEFVEGKLYVLKSSGTLQQIENLGLPNQKVTTFPSFMTSENDAEGLVYDTFNNRLLIACKGWGEGENKNQKSVYAFDLKTLTFSEKPVLTITKKQFIDFWQPILRCNNGANSSKLPIPIPLPLTSDLLVLLYIQKRKPFICFLQEEIC
ncbi:MAG: hypothetical protein HC892_00980 [Saprospiraceae bacterium]|nr:hypothetical protein [Saprospiraceae bacterium]